MLEKFKTNKQVVAFSSLELGDVSECGRNKITSINYYKLLFSTLCIQGLCIQGLCIQAPATNQGGRVHTKPATNQGGRLPLRNNFSSVGVTGQIAATFGKTSREEETRSVTGQIFWGATVAQ